MNLRYILCSILILAALSGCTGGEPPATTAAPTTAAPATTAPTTVALHGVGSCDVCHDAPAMDEWRGVLMETAFEKNPGHKDMCSNCHTVDTFCTKSGCHSELPSIMAPEEGAPAAAEEAS